MARATKQSKRTTIRKPTGKGGTAAAAQPAQPPLPSGSARFLSLNGDSAMAPDATRDRFVELVLDKEDMKFSAAHFTIFGDGNRERLHGHNFRVMVRLRVPAPSTSAGTFCDYGVFKRIVRKVCADLDERVLLPSLNPWLKVYLKTGEDAIGNQVLAQFSSGCGNPPAEFMFPADDVVMLPVENITVEDLARVVRTRFLLELGHPRHTQPALTPALLNALSVYVGSGPGQGAWYAG